MDLSKREIIWAASAGFASAAIPLLAIILSSILPMFVTLALFFPLPLYFVLLSQGSRIGAIAILIGGLLTLLWGTTGFVVLYAFTALPAYFLCNKALLNRGTGKSKEYYPESNLVQWYTIITVCFCLMGCAVVALIDMKDITGIISQVKTQLELLSPEQSAQFDMLLKFIPALLSINWAGMQFFNGAVAQKILERKGLNLRPEFSVSKVTVHDYWMYALAACGAVVFFLDGVPEIFALNLAFVLMIPHWFMGLGTVHTFFNHQKMPFKNMIWAVYALIFLIPVAHLIMVALGIFEPWIQLKARIVKSAAN